MQPKNKCPLMMCYNGTMKITLPTPFPLPALGNFLLLMQTLNKATSDIIDAEITNATDEVNTPKNRYQDKIPCKILSDS